MLGQILVQADGKVVGVGAADGNVFATRLNADGSLDKSFNAAGATPGVLVLTDLSAQPFASGTPDVTEGLALDAAGNILVANRTASNHFGTVRIKTDGTRDTSFGTAGTPGLATTNFGGSDDADVVTVQSNGQIIVAGTTTLNGTTRTALTAYKTDGSLDTSFGTAGIEVYDTGLTTDTASPSDAREGGAAPPPRASATSSSRSSAPSSPTAGCWWGPAR